MFERILFIHIYNHLTSNNLITKNQSGFRPNDSVTNQLIYLVHQIHSSLDKNLDVRHVFLDISKAFDKVWHKGLIFKLRQNGIDGQLLNVLENYLSGRQQRVVINGSESDWGGIMSGVPQGSVLGPLLFLVYINDLEVGIKSQIKFFADDTSLFSVVHDPTVSSWELNHDLDLISRWAFKWKMSFNPDPTKQAVQLLFTRKRNTINQPPIYFSGSEVKAVEEHKHLGLVLDTKLTFSAHINEKLLKARQGLGILKTLNRYLSVKTLDQIYKMYIRPHLDFCDVIYHIPVVSNPFDSSIHLKYLMNTVERLQYQAALSITGAWKGSNLDKVYEELGWESLSNRRHCRRLIQFYKIQNDMVPDYLKEPIPTAKPFTHRLRSLHVLNEISCYSDSYRDSFYPDCIRLRNRLDENFRNLPTLRKFKNNLITLFRPPCRSIFGIHDPIGIRWLYQLRVGLSPLRYHKNSHNFLDTPTDLCIICQSVENTEHYFLHCTRFEDMRNELIGLLNGLTTNFHQLTNTEKTNLMLYGDTSLNFDTNKQILMASLKYFKDTQRFN